jgi:hypothetical protein
MTPKTEFYYRAIIELCIQENIPLEIVVTPYIISPQQMQIFNYAYDIASEYDISFTNFNSNYDEIEIDFKSDIADGSHLNHRGSTKISRYIATKLKEKYIISDNRNNSLYATWQRDADYFWQSIKDQNF